MSRVMKLRSSLSGLMILVAASGLATVIMRFASYGVASFVLTTTILLETAALIATAHVVVRFAGCFWDFRPVVSHIFWSES